MRNSDRIRYTQKNKGIISAADVSLIIFIFLIEMFFVIGPIAGNYKVIIMIATVSTLCGLLGLMVNRFRLVLDRFTIVMMIFVTYIVIGAIIHKENTDMFFFVFGLLITLLVGGYRGSINTKTIFTFIKVMGIIFTIGVILQLLYTDKFMTYYYPMFDESYKSSIRRQVVYHKMYPGWTSQTFATGINLMLASFVSWIEWHDNKKKINMFLLAFYVLGIIITGKRATLLFTVLAIIAGEIVTIKNLGQIIKQSLKYIILGTVLIVLAIVFINSGLSVSRNSLVRFAEMFNSGSDISNGRFLLWIFAIKLFMKNPITGAGWGQYHKLAGGALGEDIQAHNTYLQVLSEMGIIGILLFLFLVIYLFKESIKLFRMTKDNQIKLSLLIQLYMIMYAMTGNILYDYNVLMCIFLSYILYQHVKTDIRRGVFDD